ncbi:MAG: hypothetical protein ACREDS_10215 [Limisphaerales bacterium]
MKCFYHSQIDAVAICKNCNKGLCFECAADVGNGIACKGKCESEVQAVNQMIQRGKRAGSIYSGYYKRMAIIFGLVGLILLVLGVILSVQNNRGIVFVPVGLISLLFSFHYFSTAKNYSGKK